MNILNYVDELIEQGYTPEQAEMCMEQMLMHQGIIENDFEDDFEYDDLKDWEEC